VQDIADHVLQPALPSEISQGLRHIVLLPDVIDNVDVAANNTTVPGPVCHEGLFQ